MVAPETLHHIEANGRLIIDTLTPLAGFDLGYDEASLRYVEKYCLSLRERADTETIDRLAGMVGCYLGECIRYNFGGHWENTEYGLAIAFDANNAVYPLSKVRKLFANGAEDSMVALYTPIPVMYAAVLARAGGSTGS